MKKILWTVLLCAVILCACLTAAAAEEILTAGDYQYALRPDGTAELIRYTGPAGSIVIPDDLNGHTIAAVRGNPFVSLNDNSYSVSVRQGHPYLATINGVLFGKTDWTLICCPPALGLTAYEVPEGIERIAPMAFYLNVDLQSLTLPQSLKTIGDEAFYMCRGLRKTNLPYGLTAMGDNPFAYCESLRDVDIPVGHPYLATIDGVLFTKPDRRLVCFPWLKTDSEYTVPEGIEIVGGYAFCGIGTLRRVTILDGVRTVGPFAFTVCTGLESVTLPGSVTSVGEKAFSACFALKEVTVPAGVTDIGADLFYNTDGVTVRGAAGSAMEEYCRRNGISFAAAQGGTDSYGDEDTDWLRH